MEQNAISLAKFISRYLGVNGSGLNTLSHEDAKHLFPSLKRSTFAFVENHPLELYSGNVILVTDGKKTIPYYVPPIDKIVNNEIVVDVEHKKRKKKTIPNYCDMKVYELKKLLNSRFNGRKVSRLVRCELEDRGVVLRKKYNREEFKKWREDYERN